MSEKPLVSSYGLPSLNLEERRIAIEQIDARGGPAEGVEAERGPDVEAVARVVFEHPRRRVFPEGVGVLFMAKVGET